eukprot:149411-Chlamydomonas_euryale.AAC.1
MSSAPADSRTAAAAATQVMEEVIAKSKAFKAERQRQKEEDAEALEQLDSEYQGLLASQALAEFVKPKGFMKWVQ